ncbi:unnamed protein product, partial [Ectocarpus sp. 6 AP-2014]
GTAGKRCGPSCSAALHRQPKTTKGTKCAFGTRNRDEGLEAVVDLLRQCGAGNTAISDNESSMIMLPRIDFWISAGMGMVRLARRDRSCMPSAPAAWTWPRRHWLVTDCRDHEESR